MDSATDEAIMASLLRLNPQTLQSLAGELRLRQRRLSFLLLSPPHFSLALSHLRSLSLTSKTLLLARFLLRSLSLLQSPLQRPPHRFCLRDFDAAVLLLAMCDSYDPSTAVPGIDWRSLIANRLAQEALCLAGLGGGWWQVIGPHVDAAGKCLRLVEAVKNTSASGGAAAAAAAVMSLGIAEVGECAICGEEILDGGTMPCGHPFHWGCILEWLRMRNTCPCCRFELPTVDIYGEIERVWKMIIKMGG
ncbi:E3 ubiquitin-protein ligase SGR9, amyloplastic-like [Dendrobium catenatum]|uniref:E3 ubiquitin-protein ligase RING1-like n=1 Tax=Dendrobium catenatum TaxID=906689 RepID=A0A2I0W3W7_9ASPA|nr:E3 ubiquitin-protein ligase SGR9, amyloplastic-like [Dendrobium catenatum]PKU70344.1 E3 ubiquitin-protein ligase RING1-like [Dendrobium catenatum]